ncbi:Myb-like_DNA-binding domain-containing protein [Hexamita inflata]|uniref:Myb-like DNA-binding domain-containing protein n=1 Tax=Hexamita inflata TaxID=28002 RepID=A0AA86R347_9EUKA|nr:Myb-like DNA-binding domain-containing protein [Hexamita inflata]
MRQSNITNKYALWTDQEIQKLNNAVQQISIGKKYINWHQVAEQMAPRTRQQCKSYYGQLTNQSGTLNSKFKQVVERIFNQFDANVVFMQMTVEKQILCYTLPIQYQFEWVNVQKEIIQYSVDELQLLFTVAETNFKLQRTVMLEIENKKFEQFSMQQLKCCYNNLQMLQYTLLLEDLRKLKVRQENIPGTPVTFDEYSTPVIVRYPPQQYLIQYFTALSRDMNIDKILLNLVIELSHRKE